MHGGIQIGQLLIEQGVLTETQVQHILKVQKMSHRPFGDGCRRPLRQRSIPRPSRLRRRDRPYPRRHVPRSQAAATRIGRIVAGSGVRVVDAHGHDVTPSQIGWEHFTP